MRGPGGRPKFITYRISDIEKDFTGSRKNYFASLGKGKYKPGRVTTKMYKEIILRFLTIYVYELLFIKSAIYFPLGGIARLNKCGGWIHKDKSNMKAAKEGKLKKVDATIGVYWYNRPFSSWTYIRLKKQKGSTNRFPKIEQEWKKFFNAEDLPFARELKEKYKVSRKTTL